MGIAPGDGDLMPPRFADDRQTDAEDWAQDLLRYMQIRQVPKATGLIVLRNRLTGAPGPPRSGWKASWRTSDLTKQYGASGNGSPTTPDDVTNYSMTF